MDNKRLMELAGVQAKDQLNEQQQPSLEQAAQYLAQALMPYAQQYAQKIDHEDDEQSFGEFLQDEIELVNEEDYEEAMIGRHLADLVYDLESGKHGVMTKAILQVLNELSRQYS